MSASECVMDEKIKEPSRGAGIEEGWIIIMGRNIIQTFKPCNDKAGRLGGSS